MVRRSNQPAAAGVSGAQATRDQLPNQDDPLDDKRLETTIKLTAEVSCAG